MMASKTVVNRQTHLGSRLTTTVAPVSVGRTKMKTLKASAVQMKSGPDRSSNLERAGQLLRQAAREGAQLAVLPEIFSWRGPQAEELANAETIPGPSSEAVAELAAELKIYIVAGSLLESADAGAADSNTGNNKQPANAAPPEACYNTSLLFGPEGELLAFYRKIHLFDADMPGSVSFRETDTRLPGDRAVVASTGPAVLGLSVCYDLRFPELYRELTARGAEILTVPSAFTYPTGQAHWKLLLRARAVENQAWVIAPNQYGEAGYGFADYGHSMIIDPWGRVLAEAGDDEDMVLTCELDAAVLNKARRELPCADHRRM